MSNASMIEKQAELSRYEQHERSRVLLNNAVAHRAEQRNAWQAEREKIRSGFASWRNREAAAWHEQCLDMAETAGEYEFLLDHKVGTPIDQLRDALSGAFLADAGFRISEIVEADIHEQNQRIRAYQDAPMPEGQWPHMKDNGKPLSTLSNLKRMLAHYGIHPRYNLVSKRDEALVPGLATTRDNHDMATLAHVRSLAHMNRLPVGEIGEYMLAISDENAYNPVLNWIKSKPWNGEDRLSDLLDSVAVTESYDYDLKDVLLTRWLVSAVAAIAMPSGFHARGILVFTGPQGIGKTSWFRNLLPESLSEYFREGATIDPADKDSVTGAVSNWLVEIGELDATFRKTDIARLKAFATAGEDRIRKPYARAESLLPRRTVFCGSVNDTQFLVDPSGNSRFWTIEVAALHYQQPCDDLQQLWAQVHAMYQAGEQWWLTPDEEKRLSASNTEYEQVDPLEQMLLDTFAIEEPAFQRMTSTEVLRALGIDKPNRSQASRMGAMLRQRFGEPKRTNGRTMFDLPAKR